MKNNNLSFSQIIKCLQQFYNGREIEDICNETGIEHELFNGYIRECGEIANELLSLKDENEKLRRMFTNLSLVNQSLRDSLDMLTRKDVSLIELLLKKEFQKH